MFHLHPQKRGKTSKMSTSTISYHSISAQQFFSRALLEVMCAGRRRGAAKALKNPTFSFITSSHSKTISSYYPHSRGSSVLQRCTTTLYRQRGEGSFILRTLYPRYIKQNQRRHLHTICVSCLRSWDRNSVHPVWKKGCFDFLNFCRRGGRVVVVVEGGVIEGWRGRETRSKITFKVFFIVVFLLSSCHQFPSFLSNFAEKMSQIKDSFFFSLPLPLIIVIIQHHQASHVWDTM